MVVSDVFGVGELGSRKGSRLSIPAVNTNFDFPGPGGSTMDPAMDPTVAPMAPSFFEEYMPWIIGGGVILAGGVTLVVLKKMGKI